MSADVGEFALQNKSKSTAKKKTKSTKPYHQKNILREPTYEEEQQVLRQQKQQQQQSQQRQQVMASHDMSAAANNVIQPWSGEGAAAAESEQRARNRCRRTELASLLIILFGSLALLTCCPAHQAALLLNATAAADSAAGTGTGISVSASPSGTTSAGLPRLLSGVGISTTPSQVLKKEAKATTPPVAAHETTTNAEVEELITTSSPNDTSNSNEDNDEATSDETGEPVSSPVATDNKLGAFLVRTAAEAADEMVVKLRESAAATGREDTAEADDQEEPDDRKSAEATSELLSAAAPAEATNSSYTDEAAEQLRLAMQTYGRWRATGDDLIDLFSRKLLPVIVEHGYEIDAQTMTGLLQVFNGIRALKPWALKLLDASAKLSPGILLATQSDFGDFDECLNIRVDNPSGLATSGEDGPPPEVDETTGLASSTVIGRYCLADIEFPKPPRERLPQRNEQLQTDFAPIELRRPLLNFSQTPDYKDTIFVETGNFFHMLYVDPLRVGICLTNKIEPDSFAQVLNKMLADFRVSIHFHGRCVTKYDRPVWTSYQIVSVYVLIGVCSLVALCTMLDILHTKLNKLPLPEALSAWKQRLRVSMFNHRPLFTSFSIVRNTKRLFKPQASKMRLLSEKQCSAGNLLRTNAQANILLSASGAPPALDSPLSSSSSSESSPSIERRASVTGSALNLISEHSSLSSAGGCGAGSGDKSTFAHLAFQQQQTPDKISKQQQQRENNLLCLHGIRVITMTWMIVNHTYLFGGFFVLWAHRRLIDIAEWPKSLSFQLVLNGWLTVETYFFLSAAIIVLNVMPLINARKFAYFTYILHRLVRLLPAYLGLVCLNFLWPLISSGPVWLVKGKSFIQTPCENYLWTNFLFINNWIWPEKQCMVHTWFLSADFQLYLLAPIIVYLLCRRPLFGHSLNLLVAIIASIFSGFVIYANKLMPTTLINKLEFDSIKQQLSYSYFATYQHMGPYCLGIFIGYLLHKRPQVRLPKHVTWALWLLMPPLSFTTLLLTYLWNGAYDEPTLINPSPLVSAFYVAIHRTIWTSLLAWIVFACATGRAKLMNSFLSHPIFVPLSRLSFSIYLVHLPIIMFRALNLRHTIEWTDSNILWEACGNFIASIVVGYFVNVTFESPFINLEAVIFGRPSRSCPPVEHNNKKSAAEDACTGNGKFAPLADSSFKGGSSCQDNSNDSDDCKSSETFSEQPESSPEQNRKLSEPTSLANSSTIAGALDHCSQVSPRPLRWSEYRGSSLRVKALRPKQQNSVERIFGNQVEPQLVEQVSRSALAEPSNVLLQQRLQQMAPPQQQSPSQSATVIRPIEPRFRRYSSHEIPATDEDILYPMSSSAQSRHHHYAAGRATGVAGNAQLPARLNSRPSQYATLARTSRFNHELPLTFERPLEFNQPRLEPATGYSRSGSQLGSGELQFSRNSPLYQLNNEQDGGAKGPQMALTRRRNHLLQRRQGRYNTLTGAGSLRDWRQDEQQQHQRELDEEVNCDDVWRQRSQLNRLAGESPTSGWQTLQPGAMMIPRIDSSTLRRNNLAARTETTASIVEESGLEEREEAAL